MNSAEKDAATGREGGRLGLDLVVLFTAVFCLLAAPAWTTGWFSDDYILAQPEGADPSRILRNSLWSGGSGQFSVHRLLCYPWIAAWGLAGPTPAHLAQVAAHVLCAVLLGALLLRLGIPRWCSVLGSLFFAFSPWLGQPVYWWSSSVAALHTILMLSAGCAFLSALRGNTPVRWGVLSATLALLSLLFYELYLAGFLFFFGLAWMESRGESQDSVASLPRIGRALRRSWWMLLPYALWAVLFVLTHTSTDGVHRPRLDPARIPIIVLSTQLRTVQWLTDLPWRALWRQGLDSLAREWVWTALSLGMFAVWAVRRASAARAEAASIDPPPSVTNLAPGRVLAERLIGAWILFLSARLVFVLQGGVSLNSRHNYGGDIAVAAAVAALADFLSTTLSRKTIVRLAIPGLAAMGLALVGAGEHFRRVSTAEQATFEALVRDISASDSPPSEIVVISREPGSRGEFDFYHELQGQWLEHRLRKSGPVRSAYVLRSLEALPAARLARPPRKEGSGDAATSTWIYDVDPEGDVARVSRE